MSSHQVPKRSLGNEGLNVSAIGLGTMTMPDNQASIDTIRGALDDGVTLFDTADLYGKFRTSERKPWRPASYPFR